MYSSAAAPRKTGCCGETDLLGEKLMNGSDDLRKRPPQRPFIIRLLDFLLELFIITPFFIILKNVIIPPVLVLQKIGNLIGNLMFGNDNDK